MCAAHTTLGNTQQTFLSESTEVMNSASSAAPALFLIPNLLGAASVDHSLPLIAATTVASLKHFLVEEERSARAFIKALCPNMAIRELSIQRIPETVQRETLAELMSPLSSGHSIGVISEAGCPGIADPGASLVSFAHANNMRVVPLVGPCSMVLALMASGLNGQAWRFVGYLPIEAQQRGVAIKNLSEIALTSGETQIIMDTPYRNDKLLHDLLQVCKPAVRLCIAQGLTTPSEYIKTHPVSVWRKTPPKLSKQPCLFLLGR